MELQIVYNCLNCKNDFSSSSWAAPRKYCSGRCYHESKRKPFPRFNCLHCGKCFVDTKRMRFRKYCSSKCRGKSYHKHWNPSYSCIRKRLQVRGAIKKCQKCGYNEVTEILGVHHIDKNRKNNSIDNLIVLCANCHSIVHKKHLLH